MGVFTPKSSDLPLSPWLTRKDLGPPPPTILGSAVSALPSAASSRPPLDPVTIPSTALPPATGSSGPPFGLANAGLQPPNSNRVPLSSLAPVTLPSSGVTPASPDMSRTFEVGIAAATVLGTTIATVRGQPASVFDASALDWTAVDRPPATPQNPPTELTAKLNDPPPRSDGTPAAPVPETVQARLTGSRGLSADATVEPAKRRRPSRRKAAGGQAVTFVNDKGEPVTWTAESAPDHQRAAHVVIERKLLERPDDIRKAARNFAQAFADEANRLRNSKPNESGRLAQHDSLVSFFEQMATGLTDLADALDRAFSSATADHPSPEPILLGKAAEVARWLQVKMQQ